MWCHNAVTMRVWERRGSRGDRPRSVEARGEPARQGDRGARAHLDADLGARGAGLAPAGELMHAHDRGCDPRGDGRRRRRMRSRCRPRPRCVSQAAHTVRSASCTPPTARASTCGPPRRPRADNCVTLRGCSAHSSSPSCSLPAAARAARWHPRPTQHRAIRRPRTRRSPTVRWPIPRPARPRPTRRPTLSSPSTPPSPASRFGAAAARASPRRSSARARRPAVRSGVRAARAPRWRSRASAPGTAIVACATVSPATSLVCRPPIARRVSVAAERSRRPREGSARPADLALLPLRAPGRRARVGSPSSR